MKSIKVSVVDLLSVIIASFLLLVLSLYENNIVNDISILICLFLISFNIIHSVLRAKEEGDLLQPIVIIDAFSFVAFVLRPIQIVYFCDDYHDINAFYLSNRALDIDNLPICKALVIILIGLGAIHMAYWCKPNNTIEKLDFYLDPTSENIKGIGFVFYLFFAAGMVSAAIYYFRFGITTTISYGGRDISTIDILWIYLFCSVLILDIIINKRITVKSIIVTCIGIVLLLTLAKRQFAVNIVLSLLIPYYYIKARRKFDMKMIIGVVVIIVIVMWLADIREARIGSEDSDSIINSFMNEFCMFDMLVISLDYKTMAQMPLYFGYNFLSIFTLPIPGIYIDNFDYYLTGIVFNHRFHGGVPTSFFGSLYFNFSFIGVFLGSIALGMILRNLYLHICSSDTIFKFGYLTILLLFVYDLIRVGDIGREFWTAMILLVLFFSEIKIISRIAQW